MDETPVSPGLTSWMMDLKQLASAVQKTKTKRETVNKTRLFYQLSPEGRPGIAGVSILKGSRPEIAKSWQSVDRALLMPPQFVDESDMPILRLLWAGRNLYNANFPFTIPLERGHELLEKMLSTGRVLSGPPEFHPLAVGNRRLAKVVWQATHNGRQSPQIIATPAADLLLLTTPPWYIDFQSCEAGPVEIDTSSIILRKLMALPPLSELEAALVAETLSEVAPEVPVPKENVNEGLRVLDVVPAPCLRLDTLEVHGIRTWREHLPRYGPSLFDYAQPAVRYGEVVLTLGDDQEYVPLASGEVVRVLRQPQWEAECLRELARAGMELIPAFAIYCFGERPRDMYGLASPDDWDPFVEDVLPSLCEKGWQVEYAPHF
ncbi:MAG: hypothetical protein RIR18_1974, partial [Pseudomonadota bacterium]